MGATLPPSQRLSVKALLVSGDDCPCKRARFTSGPDTLGATRELRAPVPYGPVAGLSDRAFLRVWPHARAAILRQSKYVQPRVTTESTIFNIMALCLEQ